MFLGAEQLRINEVGTGSLTASALTLRHRPRLERSAHQRESVCVKLLAGASSVVCPCIAVTGLVPAARDRVEETTGGAAHDVRRDHVCLNAAEGSPRPPA